MIRNNELIQLLKSRNVQLLAVLCALSVPPLALRVNCCCSSAKALTESHDAVAQ